MRNTNAQVVWRAAPEIVVTFDRLAEMAIEHCVDTADAVRWVTAAVDGCVAVDDTAGGPRTYRFANAYRTGCG